MLLDLLNLLRQGQTRSLSGLAEALGTSVEMVEVMLQDLGRMGHIRLVNDCREAGCNCDTACRSCPSSGECVQGHAGRIWTVTAGPPQSP